MDNLHLPLALLRSICRQPLTKERSHSHLTPYLVHCSHNPAPLLVVVVPGIADSGDMKLLAPLSDAIRDQVPLSLAPEVTVGPTPWPLDEDILEYAGRLRAFLHDQLSDHPGCRLALVCFSLGGTAALYNLARPGSDWLTDHESPLVITMASPLFGSERYRQAFLEWQGSSSAHSKSALERVVTQLESVSPVMKAVQVALSEHDVHILLSYGDRVVDRNTAHTPGFASATEVNTLSESLLRKHFGFPQHPAVIDEVISLLQAHVQASGREEGNLVSTAALCA